MDASPRLYYTGPDFLLLRLTDEVLVELRSLGFSEQFDFSQQPLVVKGFDDSSSALPKTPPPKRNHSLLASSPNKSPSSSRPAKRNC
jgi:hypothetical protein